VHLASGRFAQQLARAAAIHQADLVVIGRGDHPSVWSRLTGTKAERASATSAAPS
jgi:hypothetical protein